MSNPNYNRPPTRRPRIRPGQLIPPLTTAEVWGLFGACGFFGFIFWVSVAASAVDANRRLERARAKTDANLAAAQKAYEKKQRRDAEDASCERWFFAFSVQGQPIAPGDYLRPEDMKSRQACEEVRGGMVGIGDRGDCVCLGRRND